MHMNKWQANCVGSVFDMVLSLTVCVDVAVLIISVIMGWEGKFVTDICKPVWATELFNNGYFSIL